MIDRNEGSSLTKHRYLELYAEDKVTMEEMVDLYMGLGERQRKTSQAKMTKGEKVWSFFFGGSS